MIRLFIYLTVLTGIVYPLLVTGIAYTLAPRLSQGSLIESKGQVIGSSLIAQGFKDPKYFWPRPSFVNYNPLPSGGSNLGPTNILLKEAVESRRKNLISTGSEIPSELLYASGSGLDPHISIDSALFQINRIAKLRGITPEALQKMIHEHTEFHYVNVLHLNLALDKL
jgi:K+-transporting ATPase ATPase C chain